MDKDELRDAFAGLAMQTLMYLEARRPASLSDFEEIAEAADTGRRRPSDEEKVARKAYAQADAMLMVRRERNKA